MKTFYVLLFACFCSFVSVAQENRSDSLMIDPHAMYHNNEDLSLKGSQDAGKHYKKHKGASAGTLITSLVSQLLGLIPAIACSATTPKLENLGYPDQRLIRNEVYLQNYGRKARKMKSKRVWRSWGIGLGVNILAVILISGSK